MSKYQALIDALAGVDGQLGQPSLHSGHVIYAETEEWCSVDINVKLSANKHISGPLARFIKEAANPSTIRALLADLERAEKALAAIAQQAQEPVAWLYVDTVGERYLCFSRPTGGGAITNLYATPPAPQPAPVDERAEFERWCGPFSELRRSDFDPGRYCHSGVSLAWDAWQARAALQSPAPQTKGQP